MPVVVHTFHGHVLRGYFGPVTTAFYRAVERGLSAWSDVLVAVSDSVKSDLVALGVAPAARIRVIPLGLDLEPLAGALPRGSLRGEAGVAAGAPLVGIVGRLAPIKDLGTFLRAAEAVREAVPAVRFAVVGDGEERAALEAESARRGLQECVFFHGWRRDMSEVYGDLDVVVNCSRNEGTPVALIEALAAARPVVATRVGGTPDLLAEVLDRPVWCPCSGWLWLPVADAVLDLMADPRGEGGAHGAEGRRRALDRYSAAQAGRRRRSPCTLGLLGAKGPRLRSW